MKKFLTVLMMIFFAAVTVSAQDKQSAKDAGTVSNDGYTNDTYKISFKLPEGTTWKTINENQALMKINGKVAEYWSSLDKNVRVIIVIEQTSSKVVDVAEKNQSELVNIYNKTKLLEDRIWFSKGPNKVYFQALEAETMVGEKYKVVNYIIMRKENNYQKISLFVIYPVANYFDNKTMIEQIYRNFEVK